MEEWKLKKKRREEERELKLRKLRAQERARAHAEAQNRGPGADDPTGGPGMPSGAENLFGGIPGMADMMNDPEVLEILEDPGKILCQSILYRCGYAKMSELTCNYRMIVSLQRLQLLLLTSDRIQ